MVFKPNPLNKSAKTIKKITGDHAMYFCNTSPVSTQFAHQRVPLDHKHFKLLLEHLQRYDVILVCGNQAKEACRIYGKEIEGLGKPVIIMRHPAARMLTNKSLATIKSYIERVPKNQFSLTTIL
jgi:hypothetical protein